MRFFGRLNPLSEAFDEGCETSLRSRGDRERGGICDARDQRDWRVAGVGGREWKTRRN